VLHAPSGSLMPRSEPQSKQSSNDIQIQNEEQDSDSDDNNNAHVPKVDLVNPEGQQIMRNVYEPLPLGGPPGQVSIQPQFFFNKDLEYLLSGDKERKTALSISKLKAALIPIVVYHKS
ncbi:hypothetical protein Tco_1409711, partial [Tanacetum coccineum]